jgi:hypothetical protein
MNSVTGNSKLTNNKFQKSFNLQFQSSNARLGLLAIGAWSLGICGVRHRAEEAFKKCSALRVAGPAFSVAAWGRSARSSSEIPG